MIKLFFEFTEQTRKQMVKFFELIQNRLKIINFNNVKIKPPNKDLIQHLYLSIGKFLFKNHYAEPTS